MNKGITVSIHMKIDGEIIRTENHEYYQRGRETYAHTLDDIARLIFMWERKFDGGTTYAYDGLLQELETKLPKKNNETAESVFQKYWVNLNKTIEEDFVKMNKGDKNSELSIFPEFNDYLKYCISNQCLDFSKMPLPIKYGFLYWFYKYVMNESLDEIKEDLKNVPEYIKRIVDNEIVEQK